VYKNTIFRLFFSTSHTDYTAVGVGSGGQRGRCLPRFQTWYR